MMISKKAPLFIPISPHEPANLDVTRPPPGDKSFNEIESLQRAKPQNKKVSTEKKQVVRKMIQRINKYKQTEKTKSWEDNDDEIRIVSIKSLQDPNDGSLDPDGNGVPIIGHENFSLSVNASARNETVKQLMDEISELRAALEKQSITCRNYGDFLKHLMEKGKQREQELQHLLLSTESITKMIKNKFIPKLWETGLPIELKSLCPDCNMMTGGDGY